MLQRQLFSVLFLAVYLTSCASPDAFVKDRAVSEILAPPNGGRARVSAKIAEFNSLQYDAAFTVDVGPPSATLAYWVTNPTPERLAMLRPPEWVADRCARPGDPPRGVAIILSGWTRQSNRDGTFMPRILTTLLCQGWRMVAPDLRGFGESTGLIASYGVYDSNDLKQLLDDLQARGLLTEPVVVIGHSYGALVGLQYAAKDRRVSALLAFSGPKNLRSIGPAVRSAAGMENPVLNAMLGDRLNDDVLKSAIEEASIRHGIDPSMADGVAAAHMLKIPYLVAHGRADKVVPFADAEALVAANPARATLWVGETDDHNSYFSETDFVRFVFEWLYALPRARLKENR